MGFGMRKEVYTRKPKTAFKKIKTVYGQKPVFPKSKTKVPTPQKTGPKYRKRFSHVSDTVFFKVFIFLVLLAGTLIILHASGIL